MRRNGEPLRFVLFTGHSCKTLMDNQSLLKNRDSSGGNGSELVLVEFDGDVE